VRTSRDSVVLSRAPVVTALDMGYGHLRAAAAVASACGAAVVDADRPPIASEDEAATWRRTRRWYEALSRAADAWYAPGARRLLDLVTGIPPLEPPRDLSAPTAGTKFLARLIGRGLGAGLASRLKETGDPLVSTFYAPAIAAEAHGAARVHLVVTDSDVNRVWAPADSRRTRISFLAPTERTAARLASYGVPADRVRVTGFPLPPELAEPDACRRDFAARLARLDPAGVFRGSLDGRLRAQIGDADAAAPGRPTIVFAVGGAGAQAGVARHLLAALREPLRRGEVRVVLVAGTRAPVAAAFERWIRESGAGQAAEILHEPDFASYYRRFNATLASADVLWTKPSELTFYAALGLPLLCARPLGVHERRNREWAVGLGAALDAKDFRRTAAALPRLLADGTLAAAAWSGYTRMPRSGTSRILDAVAQS
jgi:hypothetical protein